MVHFALREFIFAYWEKYFWERSIKRKKELEMWAGRARNLVAFAP
jgi:hypothetical protein